MLECLIMNARVGALEMLSVVNSSVTTMSSAGTKLQQRHHDGFCVVVIFLETEEIFTTGTNREGASETMYDWSP